MEQPGEPVNPRRGDTESGVGWLAIGSSSQSVVESQREASGRIKTAIEIIAVASNSTGDRVDVFVKNVGVDTIIAIERSDVFLIRAALGSTP